MTVITITSVPDQKNTEQAKNRTMNPEEVNTEIFMEATYVHVCSGSNVPGNSKYSSSQGSVHPLIVFTANGKLDATYWARYPIWRPDIAHSAELVLCQGYPDSIKYRTCTYGKDTIVPVFKSTYSLTLREISSGNIVAKKEFVSLGFCPTVLTNKNIGQLKGEFPTDEVDQWLKEYVD